MLRSLQTHGPYGATLQGNVTDDEDTLLALMLNGDELSIDHRFPGRLTAPNRPGVLQTTWVHRIEVRT